MDRSKMKNELNFISQDEIIDYSILPASKKELNRNVQLFGKTFVEGGVFANELTIDGEFIYILKSVNAQDSISVKLKDDSKVWFNSVVCAKHSILIETSGKGRVRFSNTVTSQMVKLSNSIVYGNILCNEIILNNCVVLGGIYAKRKITSNNSIIGTYETNQIVFNSDTALILPFGISNEKPIFKGNIFNILSKSISEDSENGIFAIMPEEVYTISDNGNEKYVLSPFMRFFDLSASYESIRLNILGLSYYVNKIVEDVEKDDKAFNGFDDSFFKVIEKGFSLNNPLPISRFMEVEDELVSDFQKLKIFGKQISENVTDPNEAENKNVDTFHKHETIITENNSPASANTLDKSTCPNCSNSDLDDECLFCTNCGFFIFEEQLDNNDIESAKISPAAVPVCEHCGEEVNNEFQKFCTNCGMDLN